jgi:hypothetical protein
MAGGADHEGFASSSHHERGPHGLGRSGWFEVGELADVVDVHWSGLLAELALAFEEPGVAPVSDVFPVDEMLRLLEIGLQAIHLSPYHARPL